MERVATISSGLEAYILLECVAVVVGAVWSCVRRGPRVAGCHAGRRLADEGAGGEAHHCKGQEGNAGQGFGGGFSLDQLSAHGYVTRVVLGVAARHGVVELRGSSSEQDVEDEAAVGLEAGGCSSHVGRGRRARSSVIQPSQEFGLPVHLHTFISRPRAPHPAWQLNCS